MSSFSMPHLPPLDVQDLDELKPILAMSEATMGFVPNSVRTMAHMRQLPAAFSVLFGTVMGADVKTLLETMIQVAPEQNAPEENLPADLLQLVAFCVSISAGCRYCQAHTGHNTERMSATPTAQAEKRAQVLRYETAKCFSDAERAVVAVALAAGEVPNGAAQGHFDALGEHFTPRQITQIVAVISAFGFLNRWNDTVATALEELPTSFAERELSPAGWQLGKHG
jgi:AhpD family alkylhydroperoxidase